MTALFPDVRCISLARSERGRREDLEVQYACTSKFIEAAGLYEVARYGYHGEMAPIGPLIERKKSRNDFMFVVVMDPTRIASRFLKVYEALEELGHVGIVVLSVKTCPLWNQAITHTVVQRITTPQHRITEFLQ